MLADFGLTQLIKKNGWIFWMEKSHMFGLCLKISLYRVLELLWLVAVFYMACKDGSFKPGLYSNINL